MNIHRIAIEEDEHGSIVHIPDHLTPDQLGLLIQAASHNLRTKQNAYVGTPGVQQIAEACKPFNERKMTGEQFHSEVAGPQQGIGPQEPVHQFESGAKRSEKIEARYDLIPEGPERRRALRYTMGAQKYGEYNWQKGLPFEDTFNHIIEHLYKARAKYREGVPMAKEDDDLAGASLGIDFLMFFDDRGDYRRRDEIKEKVGRISREALEKMRAQDRVAALNPSANEVRSNMARQPDPRD